MTASLRYTSGSDYVPVYPADGTSKNAVLGLLSDIIAGTPPPRTHRTRILEVRGSSVQEGWRANVSKLALILNAKQGWDADHSRPADRTAVAHYLSFVASVATRRLVDAEPMLTDEGFIRMEWEREGADYVAEIGPDSLWLCSLGASPTGNDDHSVEVDHYDEARLSKFFATGSLRER